MTYCGCGNTSCSNSKDPFGNDFVCDCMMRVIIESPYAAESDFDIQKNEIYGEFAMRDCIVNYNETPYASHLLLTRKYVLDDKIPEQRKLGIGAGFYWRDVATKTVFYTDLGMTPGMVLGIEDCEKKGNPYCVRRLNSELWDEYTEVINSLEEKRSE